MKVLVVFVVLVALTTALVVVGCARQRAEPSLEPETVTQALREGVSFCEAHPEMAGPWLTDMRRSFERRNYQQAVKLLFLALDGLRSAGIAIPERITTIEAFLKPLLNHAR